MSPYDYVYVFGTLAATVAIACVAYLWGWRAGYGVRVRADLPTAAEFMKEPLRVGGYPFNITLWCDTCRAERRVYVITREDRDRSPHPSHLPVDTVCCYPKGHVIVMGKRPTPILPTRPSKVVREGGRRPHDA